MIQSMHPEEAEEHLAVIRATMERTTRFTGVPAYACFAAGALAFAGAGACVLLGLDFRAPRTNEAQDWRLAGVWSIVCAVAMAQFVLLTIVASLRRGEPPWSRLTQRVTVAVLPGIVVAAVLTLFFAERRQFDVLPSLWCLLYGCSVLGLGLYTGWKANLIGCLFLLLGSIGLYKLRNHGVELMAASFGGLHVLLGILILIPHGRNAAVRED